MLLEYQLDWIKIVDFLLIAKFWASPNNLYPPSISIYLIGSFTAYFFKMLINSKIEGDWKKSRLAQNFAINKKSTILIQSG